MVYAVYNNVVLAFRIHRGRGQNIEDRGRPSLQLREVRFFLSEDHALYKGLPFGSCLFRLLALFLFSESGRHGFGVFLLCPFTFQVRVTSFS